VPPTAAARAARHPARYGTLLKNKQGLCRQCARTSPAALPSARPLRAAAALHPPRGLLSSASAPRWVGLARRRPIARRGCPAALAGHPPLPASSSAGPPCYCPSEPIRCGPPMAGPPMAPMPPAAAAALLFLLLLAPASAGRLPGQGAWGGMGWNGFDMSRAWDCTCAVCMHVRACTCVHACVRATDVPAHGRMRANRFPSF
jgi:hypothetical protein